VFGTSVVEGRDLTGDQIIQPTPDRRERVLVREDLGGLVQCLVLVDRNQDRDGATTGVRPTLVPWPRS
jgi:hypothetical protein